MTMNETYFSVKKVSEITGMNRQAIYDGISAETFPAEKMNVYGRNNYRIAKTGLCRWLSRECKQHQDIIDKFGNVLKKLERGIYG
jgi:hypothetical protein